MGMDRSKLKTLIGELNKLVKEIESEVYSDIESYQLTYEEEKEYNNKYGYPYVNDDDGWTD
jgi:uncharacterized protein (DUF2249 family)|tara:strand:+ start:661 stop:843 length:183 start_codon:yes stop_codon:yes gene_type:complete